jgi:hypothetical protein
MVWSYAMALGHKIALFRSLAVAPTTHPALLRTVHPARRPLKRVPVVVSHDSEGLSSSITPSIGSVDLVEHELRPPPSLPGLGSLSHRLHEG